MRKLFKTQCEQAGMKSLHFGMLMGHNVGLASNYYRPPESDLLEDYMTYAADFLSIDPTHRLERQVTRLESKRTKEIAKLKEQYLDASKVISNLQMQLDESKMWIEYGKQEFQHYNDMLGGLEEKID